MRLIDADVLKQKAHLESEGMSKPITDFGVLVEWLVDKQPTIEPEPKTCEGCIWEDDYSNGPCQYCNRAHEDWYKEKT